MLGKLIKHEFKATAKLLLPLLAAVLALMGGFQVIFLVVKSVSYTHLTLPTNSLV